MDKHHFDTIITVICAAIGSGFALWAQKGEYKTVKDRVIFYVMGVAVSYFVTPTVVKYWGMTDQESISVVSFSMALVGASLALALLKRVPDIISVILGKFDSRGGGR
jgi:NO-binding membrane sensor protein with MHYT domain